MSEVAKSEEIAESWSNYFDAQSLNKYQVIAGPAMEEFAKNIVSIDPKRFLYHESRWEKFSDGTDNIHLGGFRPVNRIAGQNILLIASFYNNDVTLSLFSAMVALLQSFVESLTVVLPFYPVGTMERVLEEGQLATANTYAQMFSNLPSCGKPTRLIVYDIHTLQNRFYLHGNAVASLQTTIPLLINALRDTGIDCIAFPDDGATKRFGGMFKGLGFEIVTCGKIRNGDKRVVHIQDGNASGKKIVIVDDLVQTGGTLFECGVALKHAGAIEVSAFVAHAVFPNTSWNRFLKTGDRNCFHKFFITNSIPTIVRNMPKDDVFVILDLAQKIVDDLRTYS
jgi:ribose-phosphate pyrophosphokinase